MGQHSHLTNKLCISETQILPGIFHKRQQWHQKLLSVCLVETPCQIDRNKYSLSLTSLYIWRITAEGCFLFVYFLSFPILFCASGALSTFCTTTNNSTNSKTTVKLPVVLLLLNYWQFCTTNVQASSVQDLVFSFCHPLLGASSQAKIEHEHHVDYILASLCAFSDS